MRDGGEDFIRAGKIINAGGLHIYGDKRIVGQEPKALAVDLAVDK